MDKLDEFNINKIISFYKYLYKQLKFSNFETITPERRIILDKLVSRWEYYFAMRTTGYRAKLNLLCERLLTSYASIGLQSGDEVAYFFINILDPNLLHLLAYESANLFDELKEFCFKKFRVYDKNMVNLQRKYNDYFKKYSSLELWDNEVIKRV